MNRFALFLLLACAPALAQTQLHLVEDLAQESTHVPVRAQAHELQAIYDDMARAAGVDALLVYSTDPDINAFATQAEDGAKLVVVQEGLLGRFGGDRDAVAAVLGHELAHHKENHLVEGRRKQEGIRIFGAILGAVIGARVADRSSELAGMASDLAVNAGAGLLVLKFGRSQELEADRLTVRWMIDAGYNPRGMLRLQEGLGVVQEGKRRPAMLSTHPGSVKRYQAVQREIAKLAPPEELLEDPARPLVDDDALARATLAAQRTQLDAGLAAFAEAQAIDPSAAAGLAPRSVTSRKGNVDIGRNVSLGENVRIGGEDR